MAAGSSRKDLTEKFAFNEIYYLFEFNDILRLEWPSEELSRSDTLERTLELDRPAERGTTDRRIERERKQGQWQCRSVSWIRGKSHFDRNVLISLIKSTIV